MKGLTKLHELQQANMRKELEEKLADAVNMSDLQSVKDIQNQIKDIDNLDNELEEESKPDTSVLDAWNAQNAWINEDSPKAAYAKQVFAQKVKDGVSYEDALAEVDAKLAVHYPSKPDKTQRAPRTLSSQTVAGKAGPLKRLSMGDLTRQEKAMWDSFGDSFGSKEEFLQAVLDDRNGEEK